MISMLRRDPRMRNSSAIAAQAADRNAYDLFVVLDNLEVSILAPELTTDKEHLPSLKRKLGDVC